jgi:hypothetical protein
MILPRLSPRVCEIDARRAVTSFGAPHKGCQFVGVDAGSFDPALDHYLRRVDSVAFKASALSSAGGDRRRRRDQSLSACQRRSSPPNGDLEASIANILS